MFRWFKKEEKVERTQVDVLHDLVDVGEELEKKVLKLMDVSFTDIYGGLDEQSGAIIGAIMSSMKKFSALAEESCAIMDRQEEKLNELTEMNKKLMNNVELLLAKA